MVVKIVAADAQVKFPHYATASAAGADVSARLEAEISVEPGERVRVPTGLFLEIPEGYEAQIRPRSGLAFKCGLTVLNAPGTIDSDYRGELGILLVNLGGEPVVIRDGDRIAQMVIAPVVRASFEAAASVSDSGRGQGGFGSTGR
jgi:dUTP pyrophosphatase